LRTARGVVPVVRGWVPARTAVPAPPDGPVTVRGVLQRSETEADATTVVPAVPRKGEVDYVATVTLLAATAYDPDQLYDGFVVLRSTEPPVAGDPAAPALVAADRGGDDGAGQVGRWRNLAYAVQWWLFAAAAVFFWAVVLRRAAQEAQEQPAGPPPAGPPPAGPGAPGAALCAPPRRT
jgi:cytochrome oxidase assembly protein ShyY1